MSIYEAFFFWDDWGFKLAVVLSFLIPAWTVLSQLLRIRRTGCLPTQVGGHAQRRTVTGETDGIRWTITRTTRPDTSFFHLFDDLRRHQLEEVSRIRVNTPIGWRAWPRGDLARLDRWLAGVSLGLGDPLFDDHVALEATPLQIASAFTQDVEQRVLAWVVAGNTVERDGLEKVLTEKDHRDTMAYLDELLALARLLTAPVDPDATCVARAASNEVGPSLRAAAVLGTRLPPALTDRLRARALAQLSKGFLEEPALAVLVAHEPPGDDVTAAILPLLRSDREWVRLEAIRALRKLGTASALPALRALPPGGPWSGQRDELSALVDHLSADSAVPWTEQIK